MKKLLRPMDALLLGLTRALDIYEDFKDPLGLGTEEAKRLYGWVPARYKRHNFHRVVERGLRTGQIEKVVNKKGEVCLRLTSVGKKKLIRDFPVFSLNERKWDGRWRVVIFDIAEVNRFARESLRDKLKELGFGMLQESVWVTPHDFGQDMHDFLKSKSLDASVFVLEVSTILSGDQELLINRIWNLRELNRQYEDIISKAKQLAEVYVTSSGRNQQPTGMILRKARELREKYVEILLQDPCLPKELLPSDWAGETAREAIKKLSILLGIDNQRQKT